MITKTGRQTSDTDARRIAIGLTEQMLTDKTLSVDECPFVERAFFELALQGRFASDPLDEELRIAENKIRDINPLKLSLERSAYKPQCITDKAKQMFQAQLQEGFNGKSNRHNDRKRRTRTTRNRRRRTQTAAR